ncbi:hypothetical protein L3X38_004208 [Prunus dulcis]|uniref:Transmembrane protein n=1 Tax=Prunus dulcis TaxID=3755 RepID=A0AAD5F2X7_PRUDU|nr:hypothetical protein L3X38_004208 [Prunus dulcis]
MADHPLVLQIHPPLPHLQRSSSMELGSELANSSSTPPPANPMATNPEQFVLQIGQSSTAPPQHEGILNLKVVKPILLHINSLTPSPNPPPPKPENQNHDLPAPSDDQKQQLNATTQSNPAVDKMKINKNQKLSTAGNLANLLPTGTVLAFQALTPSISYNGRCHTFNKYLVALVILACSVICFVSSFTDSLPWEGKVYYGVATSGGLLVLNDDDHEIDKNEDIRQELKKLHVKPKDFIHAFASVFVFMIFAFSSSEVQGCYFPKSRELEYSLVIYLPLVVGLFSSFLFSIFPTKRRGIGCV